MRSAVEGFDMLFWLCMVWHRQLLFPQSLPTLPPHTHTFTTPQEGAMPASLPPYPPEKSTPQSKPPHSNFAPGMRACRCG